MKRKKSVFFTEYCDDCEQTVTVEGIYAIIPNECPNGVRVSIRCPNRFNCKILADGKCSIESKIPPVKEI